jgi:hypothetical protein
MTSDSGKLPPNFMRVRFRHSSTTVWRLGDHYHIVFPESIVSAKKGAAGG